MVTICLQCGDKGFSNALVYCVNCLEFAVHRYCLDELPATFDEFVYWVCDDCEVEMPRHFNSLSSKLIQLDNGDDVNSKHVAPSFMEKLSKRRKSDNMVLDTADRICERVPAEQLYGVHSEIKLTESASLASDCSLEVWAYDGASPVANTKEQILPRSSLLELDGMNCEVGSQQHQSSDDNSLRKMKTKKKSAREFSSGILMRRFEYGPREQLCQAYTENNLNVREYLAKLEKKQESPLESENKKHKKREKKKNKGSVRNFSLMENFVKRIGSSPSEQACEPCTENNLNELKESTELEKKIASPSDAKMDYSGRKSCDMNAELEVKVTSDQVVEFSLLNKTNKKKRVLNTLSTDLQGLTSPENPRFGPGHLSNNATLNSYELAQPLAHPIWRGSFNILNGEYDEFEGMVAHLSKKACQKAYEEARLFPTLLDLEMYPKLDVWPKSFERSEPSDDSIALYFFPAHKRYERMFDHLVEQMMNDDLAMRAILENAELLVFTSRELPLNYWRFQGKYYLWGVFRGKQPPSAQSLSNNHGGVEGDAERTEMEELGCKELSQSLSSCSLGS